LETHVLFFVAAVVAGLINSLAGGGGLITFPLLALVVPPVVADATSALALLPAYPGAVWRTRDRLQAVRRLWLWLLLATSALGGLVGALLLVWTGDRNFVFLVPWLVIGGTVLFVLEPQLSRRSGGAYQERGLATALWPLAAIVVFVVAIYGGYFGAGIGILMISALSLLRMGDVHRVVPFKNLLAGCLRGVAVVVLVIYGEIAWGYGIPMAFGGLIGGAYRQGKPHHPAHGRRGYRVRAGGVLLLDSLRPIGTTRHRRLGPTGFREHTAEYGVQPITRRTALAMARLPGLLSKLRRDKCILVDPPQHIPAHKVLRSNPSVSEFPLPHGRGVRALPHLAPRRVQRPPTTGGHLRRHPRRGQAALDVFYSGQFCTGCCSQYTSSCLVPS
jgi:uncharacterized protein